jgi:hypothetical protein
MRARRRAGYNNPEIAIGGIHEDVRRIRCCGSAQVTVAANCNTSVYETQWLGF